MAEYRTTDTGERVYTDGREPVYVEKRGGGVGRILGILALLALVVVALLFFTGFWRVNATGGSMPTVKVDAKGGSMPNVDLDSKKVVVGTKQETVEVPTVKTEKKTIDVPVVGTAEGKKD